MTRYLLNPYRAKPLGGTAQAIAYCRPCLILFQSSEAVRPFPHPGGILGEREQLLVDLRDFFGREREQFRWKSGLDVEDPRFGHGCRGRTLHECASGVKWVASVASVFCWRSTLGGTRLPIFGQNRAL